MRHASVFKGGEAGGGLEPEKDVFGKDRHEVGEESGDIYCVTAQHSSGNQSVGYTLPGVLQLPKAKGRVSCYLLS